MHTCDVDGRSLESAAVATEVGTPSGAVEETIGADVAESIADDVATGAAGGAVMEELLGSKDAMTPGGSTEGVVDVATGVPDGNAD